MTQRAALARACWVALACCTPLPLAAQALTVTGQVVHRRETDRPVARQWVVLQAAGRDTGGPVDSVRTDGRGRYRLTVERADTSLLYLVTTLFEGVEYFTEVLRAESPRVDAGQLVVYDTTTGGPPMRLDRRLLAVSRADARGGVAVQEVIEVSNVGNRARIARDSTQPVWSLVLPSGASGWAPVEGDVAPEAFRVAGDTLRVFAPIWPGWPLRASYEYALRGRAIRIPLDQWTGELTLLLEDTTAQLSGARMDSVGVHDVEGGRFAAYRAGPLEGGTQVWINLAKGSLRAEQILPYLVGAVAAALAWGLWVALRRQPFNRSR